MNISKVIATTSFSLLSLVASGVAVQPAFAQTPTAPATKMSHDKMAGGKMTGSKMSHSKMSGGKMTGSKMSHDKMAGGKMSHDKMAGGKMSHTSATVVPGGFVLSSFQTGASSAETGNSCCEVGGSCCAADLSCCNGG